MDERGRRRRGDGALPRQGRSLRGDRLRHARAFEPPRRGLSADGRCCVRHLPVAAGEGRPQHSRTGLDRGARRGRRYGGGTSPPRQIAVARVARPQRYPRRRRSVGRLVDGAYDRQRGRGPAALSGKRGCLSPGRPAAEPAMGHPLGRAPAAGQAQGDAGASRLPKARAISIKAIWRGASPPT